jgi:hypothetical protein
LACAALSQAPNVKPPSGKAAPAPKGAPPGIVHIDRGELEQHLRVLAGDDMEGRLTGSKGQRAAADYIARHFAALGLEPMGDVRQDGSRDWLQSYPVRRTHLDLAQTGFTVGGQKVPGGFAVLGQTEAATIEANGDLVFLGLGRTSGDVLDVPEGADLSGKVVLVLQKVPPLKQASVEVKFGTVMTTLGAAGRTVEKLEARGAEVVLLGILVDDGGLLLDTLNYVALSPGKDLISPRAELEELVQGGQFDQLAKAFAGKHPRIFLAPKLTEALLEATGIKPAAAMRFLAAGKSSAAPKGKPVPASVRITVGVDDKHVATNVVALRRGSDNKLADEAVVFSAHMDHIGLRMDGEVFNGADDDASGTCGLLEIAQAFRQAKAPRRSVLFLSVSGEELGLWGSAWFAAFPTWPFERLVANVNIDMIGRSGADEGYAKDSTARDSVQLTPSHTHTMFSTVVRDAARYARTMKLELESGDVYYGRSDHFNFARRGLPVVFFCTGEHVDYHQVGDHWDKLDVEKIERVARLAYWTGYAVADAEQRPRKLGPAESWTAERGLKEEPARRKKDG